MPEKTYPATEAQRATGDWNPFWDKLADLDANYLETFLAFRAILQTGPLPQKYKELIFIAINVATTHLWSTGARRHIRNALEAFATKKILEVIQLTSIMGIHSMNMGVPILMEELAKFETKS